MVSWSFLLCSMNSECRPFSDMQSMASQNMTVLKEEENGDFWNISSEDNVLNENENFILDLGECNLTKGSQDDERGDKGNIRKAGDYKFDKNY